MENKKLYAVWVEGNKPTRVIEVDYPETDWDQVDLKEKESEMLALKKKLGAHALVVASHWSTAASQAVRFVNPDVKKVDLRDLVWQKNLEKAMPEFEKKFPGFKFELGEVEKYYGGEGVDYSVDVIITAPSGEKYSFAARNVFDAGFFLNPNYYERGGILRIIDGKPYWTRYTGEKIPLTDEEYTAYQLAEEVAMLKISPDLRM